MHSVSKNLLTFHYWINCSRDLKIFANSWPLALNFKSFSWSLEQFSLTVGQNNFGNKIPFLLSFLAWNCHKCLLCRFAFLHERINWLWSLKFGNKKKSSALLELTHNTALFFERHRPTYRSPAAVNKKLVDASQKAIQIL